MFPRRTKRLAELEAERVERERDATLVEHLRQSDAIDVDEKDYGSADAFMAIFGMTRVKDTEK